MTGLSTPSLRRKILGTLLGGAVVLSAVAFCIIELGFRIALSQARQGILQTAARDASRLRPSLAPGTIVPTLGEIQWRMLGPSGETLAQSEGFRSKFPLTGWPALDAPFEVDEGAHWLRAHLPLDPPETGSIQLVMDLQAQRFVATRNTGLRLFMVAFTLLAAYGLGELIVRQSIRPLGRLAIQAALIRPKDLGRKIPVETFPRELGDLVASMNIGMERLQEAFQRLENLGTDLAHELRSPIQNLRSELEGLLLRPKDARGLQDALGSCLEELDRLGMMIEQMLFLARCEEPSSELRLGPLQASDLLRGIADYFEVSAESVQVELGVEASDDLAIMADRALIQRALSNLVSNALRHTPAGGRITLAATTTSKGEVNLEVRDTGEGIPAEMIQALGSRFTRVEHSRSRSHGGTGLGLAIVKGIMHLHGGDLELESRMGSGTTARLRFPPDPTGRTRRRSSGAHPILSPKEP
ncbi:MAG: HAMP domain-containing protein [Acidobacteria bacterium]|nr:HAMP domain-containing protein [Acidobacteriota bacterium]